MVLDKTVLFRTIIAVFYGRSVKIKMKNASDMLLLIRYMMKLYEKYLETIQIKYQLSYIEITIIGFLYNNPEKDTAADIVEVRMIPKGNVSAGVEALVQKRILSRRQDQHDRRKNHLYLLETAFPIIHEIEKINKNFREQIFQNFSKDDLITYENMNNLILENLKEVLERK